MDAFLFITSLILAILLIIALISRSKLHAALAIQKKLNQRALEQWQSDHPPKQPIEEALLDAIASLPEGVAIINSQGTILWTNTAAEITVGLTKSDIGRQLRQRLSDPDILSLYNQFLDDDNNTKSAIIDSPLYDDRHCRLEFTAIDQHNVLLFVADVTDQVTTQKMRMDFVANASHELRTPLTVINGYVESIIDALDYTDEPQIAKSLLQQPLNEMHLQSNRIMNIINDLLLLTSVDGTTQRSDVGAVNIGMIIDHTIAEASKIHPDYKVVSQVSDDRHLLGHETLFQSLVSNLIYNAINHNPVGTTVTVTLEAWQAGIQLQVCDNGQGIAPQHLPRITERFYRVDKSHSRRIDAKGGGTGLGLSIVKHAVHSSNGSLAIDSTLGEGTCIRCTWPETQLQSFRPAKEHDTID